MIICGLDECGRGPLAGPIVAAAVILNKPVNNLSDSKKLSPQKRQLLYKKILKNALIVEVQIISVRQINTRGIGWANKEVFKRLIRRIDAGKYIVDGNLKLKVVKKSHLIKTMVKADTKIDEVMAASIIAKVTRDKLMRELHDDFPNYGWQSNMGYGTKFHIASLREHGPCKHHRKLFIRTALG
jgi:ribonuclease HII